MTSMRVQYLKYPSAPHWRHEMIRLGEDEHGTWLGGPAGTIVQRADEPAIAWPTPFVQLVSEGKWWTIVYNGDHGRSYRLYVDVITPACWLGDTIVEMVDLDLDIVLSKESGRVEVLDQDEFDDHRRLLGYPAELVEKALAARDYVVEAVGAGQPPFGDAGQAWLDMVI